MSEEAPEIIEGSEAYLAFQNAEKEAARRQRRIEAESAIYFVPGYEVIKNPLDPRLYAPNKRIKNPQNMTVVELIKTMAGLLYVEGGVGLAANQIGWNVQAFIMQNPMGDGYINFINPRLIGASSYDESNVEWSTEGCLSHPGVWGEVARIKEIQVIAQTINQPQERRFTLRGLASRIFQHEMHHLQGKLFTDLGSHVRNIRSDDAGQLVLREAQNTDAEFGIPEPEV